MHICIHEWTNERKRKYYIYTPIYQYNCAATMQLWSSAKQSVHIVKYALELGVCVKYHRFFHLAHFICRRSYGCLYTLKCNFFLSCALNYISKLGYFYRVSMQCVCEYARIHVIKNNTKCMRCSVSFNLHTQSTSS